MFGKITLQHHVSVVIGLTCPCFTCRLFGNRGGGVLFSFRTRREELRLVYVQFFHRFVIAPASPAPRDFRSQLFSSKLYQQREIPACCCSSQKSTRTWFSVTRSGVLRSACCCSRSPTHTSFSVTITIFLHLPDVSVSLESYYDRSSNLPVSGT